MRRHGCPGLSSVASQDCPHLATHASWAKRRENSSGAPCIGHSEWGPAFWFSKKTQRPVDVSGLLLFSFVLFCFSFSGKVHGFLALNKLSSPQLPTRKLKFQVLHKSLVISDGIICCHHCPSVGARREDGFPQQRRNTLPLPSPSHLDMLVCKVTLSRMHVHNYTYM